MLFYHNFCRICLKLLLVNAVYRGIYMNLLLDIVINIIDRLWNNYNEK